MKGTIRTLNVERGFGFIKGQDGVEYFFHRTSLARGVQFESLALGEIVSFNVTQSDKGPRAADVTRG